MGGVAWGLLLAVSSSKENYVITLWLIGVTSCLMGLSTSRDQGGRIRRIRVPIRVSITPRNLVELDLEAVVLNHFTIAHCQPGELRLLLNCFDSDKI